uniref:Uncharacterized protein n=1 Tax=Arundo donax TaxID=35708 RepID=A0A0A9DEE5_ARUDO
MVREPVATWGRAAGGLARRGDSQPHATAAAHGAMGMACGGRVLAMTAALQLGEGRGQRRYDMGGGKRVAHKGYLLVVELRTQSAWVWWPDLRGTAVGWCSARWKEMAAVRELQSTASPWAAGKLKRGSQQLPPPNLVDGEGDGRS